MAQQYVLKRHDNGKYIYTTSAIDANNLVANGVAKFVKEENSSPAPAAKSVFKASKTEEKVEEGK